MKRRKQLPDKWQTFFYFRKCILFFNTKVILKPSRVTFSFISSTLYEVFICDHASHIFRHTNLCPLKLYEARRVGHDKKNA